jgi:hypothetical protein
MFRKLLLASLGCLYAASAPGAGACQGDACRYMYFGKDKDGCLEIRNSGREDMEVTVYTSASGTIRVRVAAGDTEKIYKAGRMCVPADDYLRSEAHFDGNIFAPSR